MNVEERGENSEMSDDQPDLEPEDLLPQPPPKRAPRGIRTFTVARRIDETGVSGVGVIIEGVEYATGQVVVHWLFPPPRGGIAIFDSLGDFLKVHVHPHPVNETIITFEDGDQETYGGANKNKDVNKVPESSV
tara:strand:+ start:235 stop:633 length:399 start_codon:yes stop_codon:yes gene_type:complete